MTVPDYTIGWLEHELHVIEVKIEFGILHHPEDNYMWPKLLEVAKAHGVSLDDFAERYKDRFWKMR